MKTANAVVGGWSPIRNLDGQHVQEIAEFAVSEHNREAGNKLTLVRVLTGETQVADGVNYRLVFEAEEGEARVGRFEAVVWEKEWENFRKLTSFEVVDKIH